MTSVEGSAESVASPAAPGTGAGGDHVPDPVAVVAALRRMLDTPEFRAAPRSRDFMAYVVTETLAGRADRIKGRTVARYALGRDEAFDAGTDAAARVQATRLRALLQRYYTGAGFAETLVIDVPRGGYVPTFAYREVKAPQADSMPLHPGVVVVQFADLHSANSGEPIAAALTESLVHALSSFPGLRVMGPMAVEQGTDLLVDAKAAARALHAQYVLTGSVRSTADTWRLMVRLSDGQTGEVVWSEVHDHDRGASTGFHAEDDLVGRIAGTVGDFRGAVLRDTAVRRTGTRLPASHAATLAYYRYADSGSKQDAQAAERDLVVAVELEPANAVLLTMLGSIENAMAIMGWSPNREAALGNAERRAGAALRVNPGYAHAWLVLAGVAFARGHIDQCRAAAGRAIELAPYHPSIRYGAGVLEALGGEWDAGLASIRESNRLNPHHPGYQHALLALDLLLADDYAGMLAEASLVDHPQELWGPLLRFLAFAALGDDDRARQELDTALALEPGLLNDEAVHIVEQLQDAPMAIRVMIRERLLDWLAAEGGTEPSLR